MLLIHRPNISGWNIPFDSAFIFTLCAAGLCVWSYLFVYVFYLPTKSPKFCGWKKSCRWVYSTACSLSLNSSSLVSDTNRAVIMFFYENEGAIQPWILYSINHNVLLITLELAQAVQYVQATLALLCHCLNAAIQLGNTFLVLLLWTRIKQEPFSP